LTLIQQCDILLVLNKLSEFTMKFKVLVLVSAIMLAGCSSAPKKEGLEAGPITPISAQQLSTSFKRQGVKIEWDCAWGTGLFESTCVKNSIKSIEVTGYASSFGNSEVMREQAFKVAHDTALDKLIRFVRQDIVSTRVTATMSKNIEKAQDRVKHRIKADEEISMSDDEASKDTNWAVRENTNNTVRDLNETIRTNAQGVIRGARSVDEKIVDRQTVAVTLRWDANGDKAAEYLRKRFVTN
jgi:hypothetical protein